MPDGSWYKGGWIHGRKHGEGTETKPDGYKYLGGWKEGLKHGEGTETWPYGYYSYYYNGFWEEGSRNI